MKLLKITAAIAATAVAATAQAETISGGGLNGVTTDVGAAVAVSAIAIVAPTPLIDGLRSMQGFPAACTGNLTKLCAPSISSAELRTILDNGVANANAISGGGTDLAAASGLTGKTGGIKEYAATGVLDALRAFGGTGAIGGFSCGQGNAQTISNPTASDAATLAGVAAAGASDNKAAFGLVHATELDGSLGFIKLDGVAPGAIELVSSNYNLVSNLSSDPGVADASVNGMTVGLAPAGAGVASHAPAACSPLNAGAAIGDVNGGAL